MGGEGLIAILFPLIALASFAIWIWGLVDAAARPDWVYQRTGSSKVLWVILIVVLGIIGSAIYLLAIRPKLLTASGPSTTTPWNLNNPPPPVAHYPTYGRHGTPGPPAWVPDPTGRYEYRWWDGYSFTNQVASGGISYTDPI
jgi:hypothetical protein